MEALMATVSVEEGETVVDFFLFLCFVVGLVDFVVGTLVLVVLGSSLVVFAVESDTGTVVNSCGSMLHGSVRVCKVKPSCVSMKSVAFPN